MINCLFCKRFTIREVDNTGITLIFAPINQSFMDKTGIFEPVKALYENSKVQTKHRAEELDYKHSSSVTRMFKEPRVLKLRTILAVMYLTQTESMKLPGVTITLTAHSFDAVDKMLDKVRRSVVSDEHERLRLLNRVTWFEVGERVGKFYTVAYKQWFEWDTPTDLLLAIMELTQVRSINVSEGKSSLQISLS